MSSTAQTVPADQPSPVSSPPPAGVEGKAGTVSEARAGMAMSVATFAMAAASAIQAVLYLSSFGTNGRTDGFFVAFALYTTFGVFSQSLRLTSVPLLVEPNPRLPLRQFAALLGLIAVPIIVLSGPLAGPMASILAPGLDAADRAVTRDALPVLGLATVAQLWAAGGATVLAIRGRFNAVAGSYIAGAAAGLCAYLALMGTADELTLGWSMLTMGIVTCGCMLWGVRTSGGFGPRGGLRLGRVPADAIHVLGRTAVYLAFNLLFVVTLSFASHASAGETTVLSYAYLFASYLVAGTGMALGMSRIPDMTRSARAARQAVVRETVPQGFRYSVLLVAPLLAALVTAGAPAIHEVLPSSLNADGVSSLRTFGLLLVPWTVAALLVNFLLPAMFAVGRAGLVNALAAPLLVLHVIASVVANELFGIEGVVGAFCLAPATFGAVLLFAGAEERRVAIALAKEMAGDATRFLVLAAVAFGGGLLVAQPLDGLISVLVAGVLGGVLYAAGLGLFARQQVGVLIRAVRPAEA
jgi:peptidoglycan biosynthesis protein MviN/MurJ (putative lipid II flippase)